MVQITVVGVPGVQSAEYEANCKVRKVEQDLRDAYGPGRLARGEARVSVVERRLVDDTYYYFVAPKGVTKFTLEWLREELKTKDGYLLDLNSQQAPLMLADFGGMEKQAERKFGSRMFGVEHVEEALARAADVRHFNFRTGKLFKEYFVVPALLCGLGTGKSTMLGHHASILRSRCGDPHLKELLDNHPLIINVTFDFRMEYDDSEHRVPPQVSLARRIIASYFAIPWRNASALQLHHGDDNLVSGTLDLLVAHHKAQHGIDNASQIAVLLNLDEIHQISDELCLGSLERQSKAVRIMRELVMVLGSLSIQGVANKCPVIPLVAGTEQKLFRKAQECSWVQSRLLSLPVLSVDAMYAALRMCGVDEQYLRHPDLMRLLYETGGVPRLVRCVLEGLTEQFDASRIPIARAIVDMYIEGKTPALPLADVLALLPVVLMGKTVSPASTVSSKDSGVLWDDLQHSGAVWLNKVQGTLGGNCQVIVPPMTLKRICNQHIGDVEVGRVLNLLNLLGQTTWEAFEEFIGCYHAFLSRTLARTHATVTLGQLYQGVKMDLDTAAIKLELSVNKDYMTMNRLAGTKEHRFPLSKKLWSNQPARNGAKLVASKLRQGALVLNSAGAAVDVLQVDPLVSGYFGACSGVLVRAVCLMHTVDNTDLGPEKFDADHRKAVLAVEGCPQLRALCKDGEPLKCVTIHITNAKVHKDLQGITSNAIVIGQDNMESFFGPVVSRALWPYRKALPMTQRGGLFKAAASSSASDAASSSSTSAAAVPAPEAAPEAASEAAAVPAPEAAPALGGGLAADTPTGSEGHAHSKKRHRAGSDAGGDPDKKEKKHKKRRRSEEPAPEAAAVTAPEAAPALGGGPVADTPTGSECNAHPKKRHRSGSDADKKEKEKKHKKHKKSEDPAASSSSAAAVFAPEAVSALVGAPVVNITTEKEKKHKKHKKHKK